MPSWSLASEAMVGRRHPIRRYLICAMQGHFPVLAAGPGELAVVFRTGAPHYGLPGTLATARSADGGRSWSDPIEVAPRWGDVRNPAFGVLPDGRWLLAYWRAELHCYAPLADGEGNGGATDERRWKVPPPATMAATPAMFVVESRDHGATWSPPQAYASARLGLCSPYGRIVAGPDGDLLMAAYGQPRGGEDPTRFDAIAMRSRDGGRTWGDEVVVAERASEVALCWVDGAHVIGVARTTAGGCVVVHSRDGGRRFGPPTPVTGPSEHPADVCRLASGRLLLTFGRRARPLGCGALISEDGGASWDLAREALLAGDGIGNDVGYPSTVQRPDGGLVTAVYFARGSAAGEPAEGWGEVSCQALHWSEALFDR